MSDIRLQEIVTRTVVGRGDRRVVWSYSAPAEGADSVLGVHVSNVCVEVEEDCERAVRLQATCDLWCAIGDETRVHRVVCIHHEPVEVEMTARVIGETVAQATLMRGARCIQADVQEDQLTMTLEATIALEVIGLARLWIKTYDLVDGLAEYDESADSLGESSSSSLSESDGSGDYTEEDEEESEELDDLATLAGTAVDPIAGPERTLPEKRPGWEGQGSRRSTLISHFQQSSGTGRVSIVQGN